MMMIGAMSNPQRDGGAVASDAIRERMGPIGPSTLNGVEFWLHDPNGLARRTLFDLSGKMFVIHVACDGKKYAAVDLEKQRIIQPHGIGLEITADEIAEVARVMCDMNPVDACNVMSWYPLIHAVTGESVQRAIARCDLRMRIAPKLVVRIARNFPATTVTVDVRASQSCRAAGYAVVDTDAPRNVIPRMAEMFGISVTQMLSIVHIPGVVCNSKGDIKRAGKHDDNAGLMLNRWNRNIMPTNIDTCGECGKPLVVSAHPVRTDPRASVQLAMCGVCADRDPSINGVAFRRARTCRRLIRTTGVGSDVSGSVNKKALSEVGLAILLALQRVSSRGTAPSIVNPLARNIASLNQFGKIVGPRLVFLPFSRLALKINLRSTLQRCYTSLVGQDRVDFEAECDKLKRGKVSAVDLYATLREMLALQSTKKDVPVPPAMLL